MTQSGGLHSLSDKQEDSRLPNHPAGQTAFYPLGWLVSRMTAPTLQRLTVWLVI
ncbi:hypothetical protein [Bacteroides fragilis]|jgi:hypothetical protein|uniref:hypothetical protein n=1 Tax=Bacteroides fragilis TaxID=817 RepID=UPI000AD3E7FB|nr:hypothetical protein [Bacteroides fragilis]MCS2275650.1 hypothetical protein [Bacteroides caccae]MCE8686404.1 hypothetical protein [Bacteroides fragilis]MCE8690002.1 hypothetical protein [Bacteroides fragilis]MCE9316495.1 hypothetical protein [Bacteroides fragilis]MCE9329288.1 hypothetical protein [Bacteroides fragilis]